MFGESLGSATRTNTLRTYISSLKKKNNGGRQPIEVLIARAETKRDLWTGLQLQGLDYESATGRQEKPPISEGCLTVQGLKEAYQEGQQAYKIFCNKLDTYLEGGENERKKLERSAGLA